MRESQYTDEYLAENAKRGLGNGLTPGTFIQYAVRGRASQFKENYIASLIRSVKRRGAIADRSKCGKVAYYSMEVKDVEGVQEGVS